MMSEIDYSQRPLTYRDVETYTQGVEIRDLARRRAVSTLPVVYSGNSDLSIVKQDFGIESSEPLLTPFNDKRGRILPAEMLNLGWEKFEETQSYHTEDISTQNGAIEPLSIRSLLTSNNAEIPGERTIKGDIGLLSVNTRPSPIQEDTYDVRETGKPGNAFFDAQDQTLGSPILGFAGVHQAQYVPFDDLGSEVSSVYYTGKYFKEGSEFGDTRKTRGRGFTYDNCVVGTDSIAFGGLKR